MKYNFNKEQINSLFAQKKRIKEVAQELNCTVISLQRYMRKENIKIAKRYTPETKENVFKLLDSKKYTHSEIAKLLNLTLTEVRSIIKQRQSNIRNITRLSNKINEEKLSNLSLFWYLVGLISTDGHIDKERNSVSVFQNDYQYLDNLRISLGHQGKIYQHHTSTGKIFKLTILSQKLKLFFIENNFNNDKRYTVPFLNCPKEYLSFYLRGLFDGDGCLSYKYISGRMEGQSIQFTTGSERMCNGLKKCFDTITWKVIIQKKVSNANNSYWDIKMANREDVLNFCKYIYSGTHDFMLKRKYIKAIKLYKILELDKQINEIVEAI